MTQAVAPRIIRQSAQFSIQENFLVQVYSCGQAVRAGNWVAKRPAAAEFSKSGVSFSRSTHLHATISWSATGFSVSWNRVMKM